MFQRSTVKVSPSDEPLYDIGPFVSSMHPIIALHSQNFDFGGFIPIVEATYEKIRGIDPRLRDRLPLSAFVHVMTNHLNISILQLARDAQQEILPEFSDFNSALPDYQCLPKSIVDYISHIGTVTTPGCNEILLNLPNIAIPQGPITIGKDEIPSGTFGPITAENHNVYEAYISPYVTSARVRATITRDADYRPLPEALIPEQLIPNANLLGFLPIDPQIHHAAARLADVTFPDDSSLSGRFKISTLLCDRVYTILADLKDRFKMVEFRREQSAGLNLQSNIKHVLNSANLTFVESHGPVREDQPLYKRSVSIYSNYAQGSHTSNQAYFETMHRRRISEANSKARGLCCLTNQGNAPSG